MASPLGLRFVVSQAFEIQCGWLGFIESKTSKSRCAYWLHVATVIDLCRGDRRSLTVPGLSPGLSKFNLFATERDGFVRSERAVPTGLRLYCWLRQPTLKRGANNHCAYGAEDTMLRTQSTSARPLRGATNHKSLRLCRETYLNETLPNSLDCLIFLEF